LVPYLKSINSIFYLNEYLKGRSRFYVMVKGLTVDMSQYNFFVDAAQYKDSAILGQGLARLLSISGKLMAAEINFFVALFPYEYQLRGKGSYFPQGILSDFLDSSQIRYVDLRGPFEKYMDDTSTPSGQLFLFDDHAHFTELGHRLAYEFLEGPSKDGIP
jgi:hypothetical protein